jgi:hypothetical protein
MDVHVALKYGKQFILTQLTINRHWTQKTQDEDKKHPQCNTENWTDEQHGPQVKPGAYSWLITGCVIILTRLVPLVEQELITFPGHLNSPPVLMAVVLLDFLALWVCFVDRCLSFCNFSLGHCVVCSSSIYKFWLPFWYV